MDDAIITFEKLYDTLRLEKYKKELQKIDLDFNKKVAKYLDEKGEILKSQEEKQSVFASQSIAKTKRQLENARALIREIYERRESKIIQTALFNSRTGQKLQEIDAMLENEILFYNELISFFTYHREKALNNIFSEKSLDGGQTENQGDIPQFKEKNVKFLQQVTSFLGEDMKAYGPYNINDTAKLPMKVSEVLIKNNIAEEI